MRPTQVDHPIGPSATAQYNSAGQLTQTVSSSGHTVNYTWNGVQLTQVQDVTTGRTVNMTYESTYNRPTSISGSTVSRSFSYPSLYRIDVQTGSHPATVIDLDTYGRQSVVTDPGGHQTRFFFTNSGLKNTDSVKAVGRTWYRYDTYGRTVAVVQPNNVRDSVTYDALNRSTASTNGLNHTTTFSYADNVFLTHVTDALGQQYQFARNALGWVEQEYRPGSGTPLQAVYDVNGNVTSATNRRSQTTSYSYDALDRVTQSASAAETITYSYLSATPSSQGYVAAVAAESSDTLFYDATDRLVRAATGRPGGAWYSLAYSLEQLIERLCAFAEGESAAADARSPDSTTDVRDLANQPPVIRYVNMIVREAFDANASDSHVEAGPAGFVVRLRIDGMLSSAPPPPAGMQSAVVSRIKLLAELDIADNRRPQDGRIRVPSETGRAAERCLKCDAPILAQDLRICGGRECCPVHPERGLLMSGRREATSPLRMGSEC